jgi:aspartyl-tRNA(Asn)/glutamyl-tRNA(Gln) amidotransferase subunit A
MMKHARAPYSATIISKLEAAGAVVTGKTNLDEFGMGSSANTSKNPWDIERVAGGSAGAAAVAAGIVPWALGIDTGGAVRQSAAFCGVTGLKPTYGAVSRHGLVAYASSLECAGIAADTARRCRAVFAIIRGKDTLDNTSHDPPEAAPPLYPAVGGAKKIAMLSPEAIASYVGDLPYTSSQMAATLMDEVPRGLDLAKERLAGLGHAITEIAIPGLKHAVPAYYTIAAAEAGTNLARFDSIRFGTRHAERVYTPDELIDKSREEGFGFEVKLRMLIGTLVLRPDLQERYYLRAERIRATIRQALDTQLGEFDAILMPVFPTRAFRHGALPAPTQKAADLYSCIANLAGLPALAFPVSIEDGLPVGMQLMGRAWGEGALLDIAEAYEQAYPFPHPAGYQAFWS